MTDQLQNILINVFQTYIEYSSKSFKANYGDMNINDVHTLHYIGVLDKANVTELALQMKITKSAITKINKRLLNKGLIEAYQVSDNKKEKYFKLTGLGKDLFDKHEIIHVKNFEADRKLFDKFDQEEQVVIEKFLNELQGHLNKKNAFAD